MIKYYNYFFITLYIVSLGKFLKASGEAESGALQPSNFLFLLLLLFCFVFFALCGVVLILDF